MPKGMEEQGRREIRMRLRRESLKLSFLIVWIQEEKRLTEMVTLDKEQLLLQEIQLLTVRERRMLKRIEMLKNIEQPPADENAEPEEQVIAGMSVTGYRYWN